MRNLGHVSIEEAVTLLGERGIDVEVDTLRTRIADARWLEQGHDDRGETVKVDDLEILCRQEGLRCADDRGSNEGDETSGTGWDFRYDE